MKKVIRKTHYIELTKIDDRSMNDIRTNCTIFATLKTANTSRNNFNIEMIRDP